MAAPVPEIMIPPRTPCDLEVADSNRGRGTDYPEAPHNSSQPYQANSPNSKLVSLPSRLSGS
jgi:hypothetical protein